uniref:Dolichyl-diphosphooligosaccharide--protein glycosyltransferase subunit 2 n=1 Tax=Phallusia mammillata TaxID=59560 RepID=A0A6F9DRJ8_9ASCI|nr:dolichyl-diphosphooligosaccharide--protein glycosyltransferase subunit 2-like [Phallusia mammillata]
MWFKGFLLLAFLHATFATELSSVLAPTDIKRLMDFFKTPYPDLETAYHSIKVLKQYTQGGAIGGDIKQAACEQIKTCDTKSLCSVFYAATTLATVGTSCKYTIPKEALALAKSKISEESDTKSIYSAVTILKSLGKQVDSDEVIGALLSAVKNDNSVLSSSYALLTAAQLDKPNLSALLKSIDIEDMAAQADEVDERYLHFENDLQTTSTFISAVIALSQAQKQQLGITPDQTLLFTNFLMRAKSTVKTCKQAANVVYPLSQIAASSQVTVAKAQLVSSNAVSEDKPNLEVSVTNVLGQAIPKLTVKVDSVVRSTDNEVIMSNVPFQFDAAKNNYKLLFWKDKPASGFYDVILTVSSPSKPLVGVSDIEFRVKVTTKIAITNVELGTGEKESSGADLKTVNYPKPAEDFKADQQQRIVMKFQVKDLNAGTAMKPHQAFVRFVHERSGQEVIFVAEPDKTSTYKFEVDLATAGADQFNSVTGKYSMHLIVGDAAISNPVFWNFGNVVIHLPEDSKKAKSPSQSQYDPKPEIHHVFRKAEARPPVIISQAFTIACLAPILLLFVLWMRAGANLRNLRLAPKNIRDRKSVV